MGFNSAFKGLIDVEIYGRFISTQNQIFFHVRYSYANFYSPIPTIFNYIVK